MVDKQLLTECGVDWRGLNLGEPGICAAAHYIRFVMSSRIGSKVAVGLRDRCCVQAVKDARSLVEAIEGVGEVASSLATPKDATDGQTTPLP